LPNDQLHPAQTSQPIACATAVLSQQDIGMDTALDGVVTLGDSEPMPLPVPESNSITTNKSGGSIKKCLGLKMKYGIIFKISILFSSSEWEGVCLIFCYEYQIFHIIFSHFPFSFIYN
jgi:hypothetical protein